MSATTNNEVSLKKILTIFAGGNLVCMILRFAGGFLTARVITPEKLGLFAGIGLVMGYAPIAQLGVINGLNRELPYYMGLDDKQKALSLASCAQSWALMVALSSAVILAGIASWQLAIGKLDLAAGWFTYALLIFSLFYAQFYLQVTYRTGGDFSKLTISNMIQNSCSLLLVVIVWKYSYYGLCARAILVSLVTSYTLWRWKPLKIKSKWNYGDFKHLLKIGLPIMFVGQIYALWAVLDSTLILRYLGTHGLGLYSVAIMIGQAIELVPTSLSQICYPRMAEEYGRSGSIRAITKIVTRPMMYIALFLFLALPVCWYVGPPAIQMLLPKYADSCKAVQWMCLAATVLAFSPINLVFLVMKRLDLYLSATIIGIGCYFAFVMFFFHKSVGDLSVFPKAMIFGRIIFILICFIMVYYLNGKVEHRKPDALA